MKSVFFDFRTAKEAWFETASELYEKKINGFWPFEIISLKTLKQDRSEIKIKIKFEHDELIKKMTSDDFVVLFDEKGRDFDSIQFSQQLEKATLSGKKRIVFVVGGAFGVSDEIKSRAQLKVSLSKMVMNHLVAETVALEQIYRALTILNRISYHNT